MTARPKISVTAAIGLVDAIVAAGGVPDDILREVGVKPSVLENPDGFMPAADFGRLLEEASQAAGDGCFGLHFGERFDPKDIGALVYLVVNCADMAVAIRNIERYVHIHNNAARVSFSTEGQHAYLRYLLTEGTVASPRQHNEYSMAVLVGTFRMLAGARWTPSEIQFAHETPKQTSEHLRIFRCPVLFGRAANALVVEHDFLQTLVSVADERLYRILKQHVERILSEMPRENDLLADVRRVIGKTMAVASPKREWVARELSMSPRTLERRLKNYGVVYKDLVSDTRQQFALGYLKERSRTVTEVAFLLGYSEVAAFNRAFKRWTGITPVEYRQQSAR